MNFEKKHFYLPIYLPIYLSRGGGGGQALGPPWIRHWLETLTLDINPNLNILSIPSNE